MTQHYTPAQLKAWAGLGPWRTCNVSPDLGHIYGSIGRLATSIGGESNRTQTNAALIAAAPDLARLVLEKDAEIARLKAALKPFVDATINADLKRLEHNDLFIRLTWPSSKGHTYFADMVPQRFIDARQAMKETSDE